MKPMDWLRRRPEGFWVAVIILVVLAVGAVLTWVYWDWLRAGETGSTTIRNIGFIIGAVIAMVLAVWRSRVAGRQAATSQHQAQIALQQAVTAERGLLNERYQKGAEMLGSNVLTVRLGGIHALLNLAGEHTGQYHVQIMRLFCSFVRDLPPFQITRDDAEAVMDAIGARSKRHLRLERGAKYWLNLRGADLIRASLEGANLSSEDLPAEGVDVWPNRTHTDLSEAKLVEANLESASLKNADLSGTDLTGTNLSGVDLTGTNLSGTKFSFNGEYLAMGLTQSQLDEAQAVPDNPPHLEGVVDAKTGKPLVWRGGPLKDDGDGNR